MWLTSVRNEYWCEHLVYSVVPMNMEMMLMIELVDGRQLSCQCILEYYYVPTVWAA